MNWGCGFNFCSVPYAEYATRIWQAMRKSVTFYLLQKKDLPTTFTNTSLVAGKKIRYDDESPFIEQVAEPESQNGNSDWGLTGGMSTITGNI